MHYSGWAPILYFKYIIYRNIVSLKIDSIFNRSRNYFHIFREEETNPWLEFKTSNCELQMVKLSFNEKILFWFGCVLQYKQAADVWGSEHHHSQLNNFSVITELKGWYSAYFTLRRFHAYFCKSLLRWKMKKDL